MVSPPVERDQRYGSIEATNLESTLAALSESFAQILRPFKSGKAVISALLAQTIPASTHIMASGRQSVAAGDMGRFDWSFPTRGTSVEVWNYDTTNNIGLVIDTEGAGGTFGPPISIAAGTYYSTDTALGAKGRLQVVNASAGAVVYQVAAHGF